MILYLDTTERDSFTLAWVGKQGTEYQKSVLSVRAHAEKLLKAVDTLLRSVKKSKKDIKAIAVVKGPGSFTSLRIGISTANALGFALRVPVAGLVKPLTGSKTEISKLIKGLSAGKRLTIVLPKYGSAPHITPAKQ